MTPPLKLPNFEGQKVTQTKLKVNGLAGNPMRAMHNDEIVYLLCEVKIDEVGHPRKDGVTTRLHKGRIQAYGEMDPKEAKPLLEGMREAAEIAAEEDQGITRLFRTSEGKQIGVDDPEDDETEEE